MRHLIRVMRKYGQQKNNKKNKDKNDDKYIENTPKEGFLKTFREHPQMAILEKF